MCLFLADLYSLHTQSGHPLIPRGGDDKAGDVRSFRTYFSSTWIVWTSLSLSYNCQRYMVLVKAVKLANQDNEIPD